MIISVLRFLYFSFLKYFMIYCYICSSVVNANLEKKLSNITKNYQLFQLNDILEQLKEKKVIPTALKSMLDSIISQEMELVKKKFMQFENTKNIYYFIIEFKENIDDQIKCI